MSTFIKHNPIAKAIKLALFATVSVSAMTTTTVFAEEAEEAKKAQVITITGSRIRSANLTSASPLQIITAEDIVESGATNLQEMLLENPTFGSPGISRTNSNFSTASAGVATVDLRNLGSDRTLVLINGRRMVAGVPGSATVDLNTIPLAFIERVEILTGGSSSVYGSDAVAGVVNLILKKNYEGLKMDVQYGESAKGDNETTTINLTSGVTSADGKGSMMFHLSHSDQGAVFSKDRELSAIDQRGVLRADGSIALTRPFFSSFPPQGRFDAGGTTYTYDQDGNLQAGFSTNGNGTIGPDGFNRSNYRTIAIPTERYLFASSGTYEVTNSSMVFFDGSYSHTATKTQLEPFPFASDDIYADGIVPLEFQIQGQTLRNPYVPNGIFDNATDLNGDGLRDLGFFAKRLSDVANRSSSAERGTFRLNVGAEGDLTDEWMYRMHYSYGQTIESQLDTGTVNVSNFRHALESVVDVFDFDGDGLTNDAVCIDATARAQGCVPVNIYGFNSITPAMAAFLYGGKSLNTKITQEIYAGSVDTADLFEMPAGPVGLVVGFEHRKETSSDVFDALTQTGQNAGNAAPATRGDFDVTEGYVEVKVPVFEGFDINAAYRSSDYSTVGSTDAWNFGFTYKMADSILMRAVVAESTRAPNIGELFTPPSQTFPSGLIDPCENITASTPGTTADNCRADPGVALNIATNGSNVYTQADQQGISGFNLGNPNVGAEVGKSTVVGFVITPSDIAILEDFSFTIDYFDYEIEDAIVGTPRQFAIDSCYAQGNQTMCSFISRRQTPVGSNNNAGSIEFINSAVSNNGTTVVEGIDLTVRYSTEIGTGKFDANFAWSHQLTNDSQPVPGEAIDSFLGEIDAPQDKANLVLGYKWDNFNATVAMIHQSAVTYDDSYLKGISGCKDTEGNLICNWGTGSQTQVDMQLAYTFANDIEMFIGLDNAFDLDPPKIYTNVSTSGNTGTETGSTYDPIGQRWYVGVRATF